MGKSSVLERCTVLGIIFLVSFVCLSTESTKADWVNFNSEHYTITLRAGEYGVALNVFSGDSEVKIIIEFVVTSGNRIDFFICDKENFQIFKAESSMIILVVESQTSVSGKVEFDMRRVQTGTWYGVFENAHSSTTERVEVDLTWFRWEAITSTTSKIITTTTSLETSPETTPAGVVFIPGFELLSAIVAIPVALYLVRRKR